MSIGPLNTLSSSYLQSIIGSALQGAGSTSQTNTSSSAVDSSSLAQSSDDSRLSPFAQLLNTLQQLQQSDPTRYQQVTGQIATNLQSAAQTAQSEGNTTAANQLNQLATDFTNASKSGQLPNVQDLAQAVGGHHHHHHLPRCPRRFGQLLPPPARAALPAPARSEPDAKSAPVGVSVEFHPNRCAGSDEHHSQHAVQRRNHRAPAPK